MSKPNWQIQTLGLIGWLFLSFAAAALGALASVEAQAFYAQLTQPSWSPPGWLFGPVWSTLYTLMGIAVWLVWRQGGFAANRSALLLFVAQLGLNALWSWVFFVCQQGALALLNVLLLWLLIGLTLLSFWRVQRLAAVLLVPYLLWVSFAALLNYTLWQLNPQLLG